MHKDDVKLKEGECSTSFLMDNLTQNGQRYNGVNENKMMIHANKGTVE